MRHVTDLQLDLYLDEGLEPDERREVESHLAACASCRKRLAEARPLHLELAGLAIEAPEDLQAEVLSMLPSALAMDGRRSARGLVLVAVLQGAAGLALLLRVLDAKVLADRLLGSLSRPQGMTLLRPADVAIVASFADRLVWIGQAALERRRFGGTLAEEYRGVVESLSASRWLTALPHEPATRLGSAIGLIDSGELTHAGGDVGRAVLLRLTECLATMGGWEAMAPMPTISPAPLALLLGVATAVWLVANRVLLPDEVFSPNGSSSQMTEV